MGVASGCGCKEVYRFPHITYPYSSCIYLFFFPYFLFILYSSTVSMGLAQARPNKTMITIIIEYIQLSYSDFLVNTLKPDGKA